MLFPQPENRNVSFPGKSTFKLWTLWSCLFTVDLFRKDHDLPKLICKNFVFRILFPFWIFKLTSSAAQVFSLDF